MTDPFFLVFSTEITVEFIYNQIKNKGREYVMIYYTGDWHGDIRQVVGWMEGLSGSMQEDYYLIQLGDAGLNYYLDDRDSEKKAALQDRIDRIKEKGIKVQILFVRGNHECRPDKVSGYIQKEIYGGQAYIEEKYPDLIFLKDGEIYHLEGKNFLTLGGGYSKDFFIRILRGEGYWFDEQLEETEFINILDKKISRDMSIYIISHMLPISVAPGRKRLFSQKTRTEYWLQSILEIFSDQLIKWLSGHYHFDRELQGGQFEILYKRIKRLD